MCYLRAMTVSMVWLVLTCAVFAQEATGFKFRGLLIDMHRSEVVNGFDGVLAQRYDNATFLRKTKGNKLCAVVRFDNAELVVEADFWKCFFDAEDYSFEQFAKVVSSNYGLADLVCDATKEIGVRVICSGTARTGEVITLKSGGHSDMNVGRGKSEGLLN
jgi:hypothetical protein